MPTDHLPNTLTIDVEEWFHILDSDRVPNIRQWTALESRVEAHLEKILELLRGVGMTATFFWLGWVAQRHPSLVRRCVAEGHEIASHGYGHLLPYVMGEASFRQDVRRAKLLLEDIAGREVVGYRAPGFGILRTTPWAFDIIQQAGHLYDASVFPAHRGHGGIADAPLVPGFIQTRGGDLFEIPASVVELFRHRISLFGGGYLRLASQRMLAWGATRLQAQRRPLVVYLHPRDIDPNQPRLPLPAVRRFKCYVNLHTTLEKVKWLCGRYRFGTMRELMLAYLRESPTLEGSAVSAWRLYDGRFETACLEESADFWRDR